MPDLSLKRDMFELERITYADWRRNRARTEA
jgi:hypothetical protein